MEKAWKAMGKVMADRTKHGKRRKRIGKTKGKSGKNVTFSMMKTWIFFATGKMMQIYGKMRVETILKKSLMI